jgi:hypothetical protein
VQKRRQLPPPRNPSADSRAERSSESIATTAGEQASELTETRGEITRSPPGFAVRRIIAAVATAAVEKRNMQSGNLTAPSAPCARNFCRCSLLFPATPRARLLFDLQLHYPRRPLRGPPSTPLVALGKTRVAGTRCRLGIFSIKLARQVRARARASRTWPLSAKRNSRHRSFERQLSRRIVGGLTRF